MARPATKAPAERFAIFKEHLREQGHKSTAQRDDIAHVFFASKRHISVEELYQAVKQVNPRIGYATVYRTLKLLVDSGLAVERQFGDGQARFEVVGDHHDHLICVKCGLILEFEDDEIERLQDKIASRLGGFTVLRHRHELYGLCPKAAGEAGGSCPRETKRGS